MDHFDVVEWTDWVRGVVSPRRGRAMAAHLESGCQLCGGLVRQLQRVVADAAVEAKPPSHAVRAVRALVGLFGPSETRSRRRLPIKITFDSFLEPAIAGTRGLECTSRHLVFNSSHYTVDTRLDYGERGANVNVVGQIVNRRGLPVSRIPAYLLNEGEVLSQAFTSSLGEFQMECRPEDSMRLCLTVDERRLIEVELERPGARRDNEVAQWDFRRGNGGSDDLPPLGLPPRSSDR